MKPNELRIGNYVLYENPHSDRVQVQVKAVDFQCGTHNLHPIPLTEEWLVKLGFIRDSNLKNSLVKNGIWFNSKNMEATYLSSKLIKINYVHQLQNLIFALTGEELIIK
jgi:hypothetical protein